MAKLKQLVHTVTLQVTVPYRIKAEAVENAINAALDEPTCDWGDWVVGSAQVKYSEERG